MRGKRLQIIDQTFKLFWIFIIALEQNQTTNALFVNQFFGSGIEAGTLESRNDHLACLMFK